MNRRLRTAVAVTAMLGAGLLMTACQGDDTTPASADATSNAAAESDSSAASGQEGQKGQKGQEGSTATSGGEGGDKSGYGQSCGTNDISWSVSSETQAGGYYLIKAEAKPGITCVMPVALPVVAFGSDGTVAKPAEQSAGQEITLREGVAAYAGVNPKTTKEDGGKELDSLIVSVSDGDPNPVSLKVDSFVVDQPIVTSWHTSASDAVPFSS